MAKHHTVTVKIVGSVPITGAISLRRTMVVQHPVKVKVLGSNPSVGAILGFRLTVGRLPLKERILVRIQVTQP